MSFPYPLDPFGNIAEREMTIFYETERLEAEIVRLRAQVAELEKALIEYACTGTEHPCGCYTLLNKDRVQVAELRELLASETRRAEDAHGMTMRQSLAIEQLREALQRLLFDLEHGSHYSIIATQIGDIIAKITEDK